jgi:hypothetical protein
MTIANRPRTHHRLVVLATALLALIALPLLSQAHSVTTSVRIVNNSNKSIRNVYLAATIDDTWSGNQLGDTTLSTGQSANLNLAQCNQQISVIAEDEDGCFLTTVVTCGSDPTWTVTNDTQRDCGY